MHAELLKGLSVFKGKYCLVVSPAHDQNKRVQISSWLPNPQNIMQSAIFGNVLMRRRGHQSVTLLFRILQEQHRLPVPNVGENKTTLVVIAQLLNRAPWKCRTALIL